MKHQEIMQQIQEIFRENFDNSTLVITRDTCAEDIPEWDSLEHINILTAVEQHFRVKFALDDLHSLSCVGDIADFVARQLS